VAVPAENIEVADKTVCGLECFPTPGHARHHISFMNDEGMLFGGDVTGLRLVPSDHVLPTTPPPDIDLEAWHLSLDEIERRVPDLLALPHYGVVNEPELHLAAFRQRLMLWAERVRRGISEEDFVAEARAELDPQEDIERLEQMFVLQHSYLGLRRYWGKLPKSST